MHARLILGASCSSGYSKKTELYISGDLGLRGVMNGLLDSDMVDNVLLVTTDQRNESFLSSAL